MMVSTGMLGVVLRGASYISPLIAQSPSTSHQGYIGTKNPVENYAASLFFCRFCCLSHCAASQLRSGRLDRPLSGSPGSTFRRIAIEVPHYDSNPVPWGASHDSDLPQSRQEQPSGDLRKSCRRNSTIGTVLVAVAALVVRACIM